MKKDDRLIFLLSIAQQAVKNYSNKALAEEGVRITCAQSAILFLLKQQNQRMMSNLGKILGIENSGMTGMVDRLERSGFVTRVTDPADRRSYLISATPAGLEEAEKAKVIIRRVNDAIKSGYSEHDVEAFRRILQGILEKFKAI